MKTKNSILSVFLSLLMTMTMFVIPLIQEFPEHPVSISASAETIHLKAWVSDTEYGTSPDVYHLGETYYLCYELTGEDGKLATGYTDYDLTATMYRPDGTEEYSTSLGSNARGWISCRMTTTGMWSGTVSSTGKIIISLENPVTWNVTFPNLELKVWTSNNTIVPYAWSSFKAGEKAYLYYEILDKDTGERMNENITGYTVSIAVYTPDGEEVGTVTRDSSPYDYASVTLGNASGAWYGTVSVSAFSLSNSVSWNVTQGDNANQPAATTAPASTTTATTTTAGNDWPDNLYLLVSADDYSHAVPSDGKEKLPYLNKGYLNFALVYMDNLNPDATFTSNIDYTMTIYAPDGSVKASRQCTYTQQLIDSIDTYMDVKGTWKGVVEVTVDGATKSETITWEVVSSKETDSPSTTKTAQTTTTTTKTSTKATTATTKTTTTVPTSESKTIFEMGQDNWSFRNSESVFQAGYYRISDNYLRILKSKLSYKEQAKVDSRRGQQWGGSCYGMASTAILAAYGILDPTDYKADAKYLSSISGLSEDVESLINYYYLLQYTDVAQNKINEAHKKRESQKLEELVDMVYDGTPALLCYYSNYGGHAVVAYDVEYGTYPLDRQTYTGRVLIYDNRLGVFNDKMCLYFNTAMTDWYLPYDGLYSENETGNGSLGLITDNLDIINYDGYLDSRGYDLNQSYIASLTVDSDLADYSFQKIRTSSSSWDVNGVLDDDDIIVVSSLRDEEGAKDTQFILRDASSGYALQLAELSEQSLYMDYENCLLSAESNHLSQVVLSPEGYIEITGKGQIYDLKMVFNDGFFTTDWYTLEVSGSDADSASLRQTKEGYVITGNLQDVTVQAKNDNAEAALTFSTDYPKALIYEIDETTIGVKIDTDNDGFFEAELGTEPAFEYVPEEPAETSAEAPAYEPVPEEPSQNTSSGSAIGGLFILLVIVALPILILVAIIKRIRKKKNQ